MQRSETEINAISEMYFNLMKVCYNKCTTNYGNELDSTEERCIDNCVDKYFEITKIVTDVAFPQPGQQ